MTLEQLLDRQVWLGLGDSVRRDSAGQVAERTGLRLVSVEDERAFFEKDGTVFALVPGGRAELGFDGDLGQQVSAFDPDAVDRARRMASGPLDMGEFQQEVMTPRRVVEIAPFLAECDPKTTGAAYFPDEWDEVDGELGAVARRSIQGALARQGLRLATSDEWEYMYAAGATTFFPWGDSPREHYLRQDPWTQPFGLVFRGETEAIAGPLFRGGDGGIMALSLGSGLAEITAATSWVLGPEVFFDAEYEFLQEALVRTVLTIE
jgi:hypothetical protein